MAAVPRSREPFTLAPTALAAVLVFGGVAACNRDQPASMRAAPGAKSGAVTIHEPAKLTSIEAPGKTDSLGRTLRVACVTCHSVRDAGAGGRFPERASDLHEFHVGLVVDHGKLPCLSCHVDRAGGVPKLHLADGTEITTADAMRLCGQCHGPKLATYQRGAHGGMNGYWDLSKGGRLRNHCVDCHDPHLPAFQPSRPVLPPRDRGVLQGGHEGPSDDRTGEGHHG
jgi:cytochrome c553